MLVSVLISIFFGVIAATALAVDAAMVVRGLRAVLAIHAELALLNRAADRSPAQVRQYLGVCAAA